MEYQHNHYYFLYNNQPWTIRLQGDTPIAEEILVHSGRVPLDELDVGWLTIRSPFETVSQIRLPAAIVAGLETWADYGFMMPVQKFLNGLIGRI
jgi:hypothetical protein